MANKIKRVNMHDVARESGVSVSTVSLALREKPGIPPETRRKVTEAARCLGYRLKGQKNSYPGTLKNVGLVVKARPPDLPQTNQFYSHVMVGIETACRQYSLNLMLASILVDGNNIPVEVPQTILEGSVDGLLVVGAYIDPPIAEVLHRRPIPVVLVDAYAAVGEYDAVLSDNIKGACQAVSYLICLGHQHIGLVGGGKNAFPSLRERREAFQRTIQEHPGCHAYYADCNMDPADAIEATVDLIQRNPQISAIFGINDETAIAVMRAAAEIGLKVPQDLSVIGFDNIQMSAQVIPPLTTMHVDKINMGRLGVQLLLNRVNTPEAAYVTSVIQPQLIERSSVETLRFARGMGNT